MQTPPKFTSTFTHRPNYGYKGHFAPPEGWRLVNLGEKYKKGDFWLSHNLWVGATWSLWGTKVSTFHANPVIRAVSAKRGPKGRFVSSKPAVLNKEMAEHIENYSLPDLLSRIPRIKDAIAGRDVSGIMQFTWTKTPQQNGEYNGYWAQRCDGRTKLSDSDLDYMKLVVGAMEARAKVLEPVKVPVKTEVETLKEKIVSLEAQVAKLEAWKAGVAKAFG